MKRILTLIACMPTLIFATELAPWFSTNLEIQSRLDAELYTYHSVNGRGPYLHRNDCAKFYHGSLLLPFEYMIGEGFCAELEATVADTRYQDWRLDNMRLTARYKWLNDITGDPVSLVTGLTLTQAFTSSLRDISSFHHGRAEMEAHVSIGREVTSGASWKSRWWTLLAVGLADQGTEWIRTHSEWEKNWCDRHAAAIFLDTLWGMGSRSLHTLNHFHGYGLIRHQSVDLGLNYHYLTASGGTFEASYAYRVFARNFPQDSQLIKLSLIYPFGI